MDCHPSSWGVKRVEGGRYSLVDPHLMGEEEEEKEEVRRVGGWGQMMTTIVGKLGIYC